jgi:hypothetical protein
MVRPFETNIEAVGTAKQKTARCMRNAHKENISATKSLKWLPGLWSDNAI